MLLILYLLHLCASYNTTSQHHRHLSTFYADVTSVHEYSVDVAITAANPSYIDGRKV